jgi:uncharacterized protein
MELNPTGPIKIAVVTGSHPFDVINFHNLFRSMNGIDTYIQHLNDFACSPQEVRDSYDVCLFYHFVLDLPTDEGIPWYSGTPRTALQHLGNRDQGIVVLHHAILAYQDWPVWNDLVGIHNRKWDNHTDQVLDLHINNPVHPITQGLNDWRMGDETYTMADTSGDSTILLTVDHPVSMKTMAWTRHYKNSRVFCYQSGHDNQAYSNPNYRTLLERGIKWTAKRL